MLTEHPGPGKWDQGDENTGIIPLRSDLLATGRGEVDSVSGVQHKEAEHDEAAE